MLTDEQRSTLEKLLIREREQVLDALGHHDEGMQELRERSGELSAYRLHPADIGSEEHEQEKDFMITSMEGTRLYQIDDALRRLYAEPDSVGRCTKCGAEIEWARLEVIPETNVCAEHARELDVPDAADPREASRAE